MDNWAIRALGNSALPAGATAYDHESRAGRSHFHTMRRQRNGHPTAFTTDLVNTSEISTTIGIDEILEHRHRERSDHDLDRRRRNDSGHRLPVAGSTSDSVATPRPSPERPGEPAKRRPNPKTPKSAPRAGGEGPRRAAPAGSEGSPRSSSTPRHAADPVPRHAAAPDAEVTPTPSPGTDRPPISTTSPGLVITRIVRHSAAGTIPTFVDTADCQPPQEVAASADGSAVAVWTSDRDARPTAGSPGPNGPPSRIVPFTRLRAPRAPDVGRSVPGRAAKGTRSGLP
ncbi:hypothetical protein SAMN04489812_0006 [Microlunatus soli]|uniref:Uncharacterized protein n=1 Tax=Microlunatus soli TaxID=630515 RepID=A0A1H1M5E7_9ACTN|nr:hypothetical protein SAMN04489812_0006 [Microlunatus soli]